MGKKALIFLLVPLLVSACAGNSSQAPTLIPTLAPPTPVQTGGPPVSTPPTPVQTVRPPVPTPPTPTANVTPTPLIVSACPAPAEPAPPPRPDNFDDYTVVLADYLSQGASAPALERLLRDWGAIMNDASSVRTVELTGDLDDEIVVLLVNTMPELDLPWPSGDLLIYQCQAGAMTLAYWGRLAGDQPLVDFNFSLHQISDVNGTGLQDVLYITSTCGAHTCFDRLYVVEWDGEGFVNRAPHLSDLPYATFDVGEDEILIQSGGIGSVGAGIQRSYREKWRWNGQVFTRTETLQGPPLTLIHYAHDGDDLLAQGNYAEAANLYQQSLDNVSMSNGLFLDSEEQGLAVVKAYARFKLMVAFAALDESANVETQYTILLQEHPEGAPGYPFVSLAQTFWVSLSRDDDAWIACESVIAVAQNDPTTADLLYAGYANPTYAPEDLCRLLGQ